MCLPLSRLIATLLIALSALAMAASTERACLLLLDADNGFKEIDGIKIEFLHIEVPVGGESWSVTVRLADPDIYSKIGVFPDEESWLDTDQSIGMTIAKFYKGPSARAEGDLYFIRRVNSKQRRSYIGRVIMSDTAGSQVCIRRGSVPVCSTTCPLVNSAVTLSTDETDDLDDPVDQKVGIIIFVSIGAVVGLTAYCYLTISRNKARANVGMTANSHTEPRPAILSFSPPESVGPLEGVGKGSITTSPDTVGVLNQ